MSEVFQRKIYLLSPRELSPETIAVTFAKTSRSPLSFREIADELTDDKSAEFHEKWVVGYGHASVAEHAVLHIAFENVSRMAIECIESNRLASYTEKSTRYQHWDVGGYLIPQEVIGGPMEKPYREICDRLFKAYHGSLQPVKSAVMKRFPRKDGESEARWGDRIRSRYTDACRFLLPAAAFANVGMTVNARSLEHAIQKMISHPLEEVQDIGRSLKRVTQAEVPTLVKYADHVPYISETEADIAVRASSVSIEGNPEPVRLIAYEPEAELRVMASALYAHAGCDYETALAHVRSLNEAGKRELAQALLGRLVRFDVPARALEHAVYTFDILLDQGAYFELKRHRMMTQTPQRLTADLGYTLPRLIVEANYEKPYREVMEAATEVDGELAKWNPYVAAYVVPNGFNRRVVVTLNLREIYHFCELRSQPNAHFSMRRIALRMAEIVRTIHPTLAAFMRLPEDADWRQVEVENFMQV
jgi:thymidylate synthase ThyX